MTNPINYPGITINITNPTNNPPQTQQPIVYPQPQQHYHQHCCHCGCDYNSGYNYYIPQHYPQPNVAQNHIQQGFAQPMQSNSVIPPQYTSYPMQNLGNQQVLDSNANNNQQGNTSVNYPVQYYMNNYNYTQPVQNNEQYSQIPQNTQDPQDIQDSQNIVPITESTESTESRQPQTIETINNEIEQEEMSVSNEIIQNLEQQVKEEKETQKKQKKIKIVALTNEYIMSLENYLNNPNKEVRLLASKEILKRFNEDKDRYNDAALNALINKMLQDPEKLVRIAALSALSSELASGNDYTIELLNKIQSNPKSTPEDVLEASSILLKMSAMKEFKYTDDDKITVKKVQEKQTKGK